MKLYAVKTLFGYLKNTDGDSPLVVPLAKASVFPSAEDAVGLRDRYGEGDIVELILTEKVISR